MKDSLEVFFAAQRLRIRRALETRAGEMDDVPEVTEVGALQTEVRGNCTHATGRRKPSSDDQAALRERGGLVPGKRRQVVWANLERKAGRMKPWSEDDHEQ